MRRFVALLIGLAVLGALAWVALEVARHTAPARLRAEVEGLLAGATHAPVEIEELRLVRGLPIHLEASGLRLYEGALTAEHASARIDLISLLTGHPRLTQLRLDGARAAPDPGRRTASWQPQLGKPGPPGPVGESWLEPLRDRLGPGAHPARTPLPRRQHRGPRRAPARSRAARSTRPCASASTRMEGTLLHRRLLGIATLELKARWADGKAKRAALEWKGRRGPDGRVALTLNAGSLDLAALAPGLQDLVPGLRAARRGSTACSSTRAPSPGTIASRSPPPRATSRRAPARPPARRRRVAARCAARSR